MSLAGRVALVTGAGRGIGRAIALGLAEDGADVAVNYRRDEVAAKQTVADIEKLGRRAQAYCAPINDFDAVESMVESAIRDLGPISILVNNAGIASRGNNVEKTDPLELERLTVATQQAQFLLLLIADVGQAQVDRVLRRHDGSGDDRAPLDRDLRLVGDVGRERQRAADITLRRLRRQACQHDRTLLRHTDAPRLG